MERLPFLAPVMGTGFSSALFLCVGVIQLRSFLPRSSEFTASEPSIQGNLTGESQSASSDQYYSWSTKPLEAFLSPEQASPESQHKVIGYTDRDHETHCLETL